MKIRIPIPISAFFITLAALIVMNAFQSSGAVSAQQDREDLQVALTPTNHSKICISEKNISITFTIKYDESKRPKGQGGSNFFTFGTGPMAKLTANHGSFDEGESNTTFPKNAQNAWTKTVHYTPSEVGTEYIKVTAYYKDVQVTSKPLIFEIEKCKLKVGVYADENTAHVPSGESLKEAIKRGWDAILTFEGIGEVKVEPSPGGGKKKLELPASAHSPALEDGKGTVSFFADAIWIGKEEFVCGTGGPLTLETDFDIMPVANDENIDLTINIASGQTSAFTVWCKGEGGQSSVTIPSMPSLPVTLTGSLPWEGGSFDSTVMLPHGASITYRVTGTMEEEK